MLIPVGLWRSGRSGGRQREYEDRGEKGRLFHKKKEKFWVVLLTDSLLQKLAVPTTAALANTAHILRSETRYAYQSTRAAE
jgi:hypothetical protein